MVRQGFRVWHYESEPVELVSVVAYELGPASAARSSQPVMTEIDVGSIFSQTQIAPGKSLDITLTVPFANPEVYGKNFIVDGTTESGMAARGGFSVLKPPPKPTAENSTPISDPVLIGKIKKAMRLLHKDVVSQEDLWRLSGKDVCSMTRSVPFLAALLLGAAGCSQGGPEELVAEEGAAVTWDGLSGRVAYTRWDQGAQRSYTFLLEANSRTVTLVRDAPASVSGMSRDLAFRTDGSTLTYSVLNENQLWELRDYSFATRAESALVPDPTAHHNYASWSRLGRLAYYVNGAAGAFEAVDGQPLLAPSNPGRVAWAAPDKVILSVPSVSSTGDLVTLDTTTLQMVTAVSGGQDVIVDQPALSLDGTRLAYVRRGSAVGAEEIWVSDADGGNPRSITTAHADSEPAWLADGGSLLFLRFREGLFLYDLSSGSIRRVTAKTGDSMAWSPD